MAFEPHGKHLIAGEWVASGETFASQPVDGRSHQTANGGAAEVNRACEAAEEAFAVYGNTTRAERATFLNAIADEIDARKEQIVDIATRETGLPEARIVGETGRTTGQLRLFASHIEAGDYLDRRHDAAMPDREPLPRPELFMMQRPIGPVAVFGASNFPLAFSTAGGDTASALAAGCPVVVKGHQAHPGTGEIVAEAIYAAINTTGMPAGTFSLIQGDTKELGGALVQHELINAVGFTGSLGAGRALFNLCAQRPVPIPFFGELGSINPVFLLPNALRERAESIAAGWSASLSMGAGQFCTNPGILVAIDSPEVDQFEVAAKDALAQVGEQTMLTDAIAGSYRSGRDRVASSQASKEVLCSKSEGRNATPDFYTTTGADWLDNPDLHHEVFGPLGILVRVSNEEEMVKVANSLQGQLTCTLTMENADTDIARKLVPVLERKAGRILVNGLPTGVEVADTMVHGGPYPASTNFGATSVGTLAIRRFLRPVCYQNVPHELLPEDLR